MRKYIISRKVIMIIALIYLATLIYQTNKPLPAGLNLAGALHQVPADSITFLSDLTYLDSTGARRSDQQIFDEVFNMINAAEHYILVDMFLFNDFQGKFPETTRALSQELTTALIAKKAANSNIIITVISDPLNTLYGGFISPHYQALTEAGIPVIQTDLNKLRDSNPVYSSVWRWTVRWLGNSTRAGLLPHPFSATEHKLSLRSWLTLVNFKANHRKVIVADFLDSDGQSTKLATLITSANPHDGSSAHTNVAIKVIDKLWQDAVKSEQAIAQFSQAKLQSPQVPHLKDDDGEVGVQLLTEQAIKNTVIEHLNRARMRDTIDLAMFYLSDRLIVASLIQASQRGAKVRLILDPNKDAFGFEKNGVPNRPVAHELLSKTDNKISVRWCDTHGEQCHTKLMLLNLNGQYTMVTGSANFTRRNLDNYNLETNILISASSRIPAINSAYNYMEKVWTNSSNNKYTTDYSTYADTSFFKKILYRVQEGTGLSSF